MVLLALIVAVPFTMFDTAVMVRGSLSGSLSLASTAMLTAVPAAVVAVSATAMGGVLPGVWPSKVAVTLTLRTLWVLSIRLCRRRSRNRRSSSRRGIA